MYFMIPMFKVRVKMQINGIVSFYLNEICLKLKQQYKTFDICM